MPTFGWARGSEVHNAFHPLVRYLSSLEDEAYHIYADRKIDDVTMNDFASASQEVVSRISDVASTLNREVRGYPNFTGGLAAKTDVKSNFDRAVSSCNAFTRELSDVSSAASAMGETFQTDGWIKSIPATSAQSLVQAGLACQVASAKAIADAQQHVLGAPKCDPATVMINGLPSASMSFLSRAASLNFL